VTAAADNSVLITPLKFKGDGTIPGIIYLHGGTGYLGGYGTFGIMDPVNTFGEFNLITALSKHWPIMVSDLGGIQTWGNATAMNAIAAARTALIAAGAKNGPMGLVGASMGHDNAIQYANAHLANVACIAGIIGLCDVGNLYSTNALAQAASIAAAWGVTYPAALPAGAEIKGLAAGLRGLPWQMWCSDGDTVIPIATVQAFGAAIGGPVHITNHGDHGEASIDATPTDDLVKFMLANLGTWQG
jgi:hypothetical protein